MVSTSIICRICRPPLVLLLLALIPVRLVASFALGPPRTLSPALRPSLLVKNTANDGASSSSSEDAPAAVLNNNYTPKEEEWIANKLPLIQQEIETGDRSSVLETRQQWDHFDDDDVSSLITRGGSFTAKSFDLFQRCSVLVGTATLLACGWNALLHEYEWFQAWRYTWPLLGGLFVADAVQHYYVDSLTKVDDNTQQSSNTVLQCWDLHLHQPGWIRCLNAVAGVGLLVGGAYDAFMPVWMTGPNVVTAAGIGQDSAALLCLLTVVGATATTTTTHTTNNNNEKDEQQSVGTNQIPTVLSHAVLLSQFYVLGDSAFQDLLSGTVFS